MQLVTALQLFILAYSAMLGLYLLLGKPRTRYANAFLGAFLVLLAFDLSLAQVIGSKLRSSVFLPTWMLEFGYGPSFYFFVKAVVHRDWRFSKREFAHLLVLLLPLGLAPFLPFRSFLLWTLSWAIFTRGAYLAGAFRLLNQHAFVVAQTKGQGGPHLVGLRRATVGITIVLGLETLNLAAWYLQRDWFGRAFMDLGLILVLITTLVVEMLRYPERFEGLDAADEAITEPDSEPPTAQSPQLPMWDEALKARVARYLEEEQPFSQPNLSLNELAAALRLPPRTLSRLINEGFGRNFSDFINGYRIQAAKDLLSDPKADHLSVMEILFRVGFNAKSTFNLMFKREVGMTPTEFRARRNES